MRKNFAVILATTAGFLSGSAFAADLPSRYTPAPAPLPPVFTWTGFYLGLNAGYGISSDPTNELTVSGAGYPIIGAGTALYGAPSRYNLAPDGFVGGGQVGYNLQLSPSWVAGLEADFQGSTQKAGANCVLACGGNGYLAGGAGAGFPLDDYRVVFSSDSYQQKIDWFGTVRGRLGFAAGPVLVYGTGGLAYGEVDRSGAVLGSTLPNGSATVENTFGGAFSSSSTRIGWTLGGGVEGKLSQNWSVKAEYLYIDLGKSTDSFNTNYLTSAGAAFGTVGAVAATRTISSSYKDNVVRVGLNYKFGG